MKVGSSWCVMPHILSVIRQKGESQNGCFKKTKQVKFSEKRLFFTTWYARVSGGKKWSFFGKFDVLCFLEIRVLRFALLSYYRRFIKIDRKLIMEMMLHNCLKWRGKCKLKQRWFLFFIKISWNDCHIFSWKI